MVKTPRRVAFGARMSAAGGPNDLAELAQTVRDAPILATDCWLFEGQRFTQERDVRVTTAFNPPRGSSVRQARKFVQGSSERRVCCRNRFAPK